MVKVGLNNLDYDAIMVNAIGNLATELLKVAENTFISKTLKKSFIMTIPSLFGSAITVKVF